MARSSRALKQAPITRIAISTLRRPSVLMYFFGPRIDYVCKYSTITIVIDLLVKSSGGRLSAYMAGMAFSGQAWESNN